MKAAVSARGENSWTTLYESVLLNSQARIELNDFKDPKETQEYITKGNVTEQGLLKFFMNSLTARGCLQVKRSLTDEKILCVVPFTSSRKRGSIVVRREELRGTDREVRVYCKGAPDVLFPNIQSVIGVSGEPIDSSAQVEVPKELLNGDEEGMNDSQLGILERTVKLFASQAFRTILVSYRDMSMDEFERLKAENNGF